MSTDNSACAARLPAVLAVLLATGGCAAISELPTNGGVESDAGQIQEEFSHARVIELLQEGEAARAEAMLQTRLEAVPQDNRSRELMRQIQAAPTEYLGEASFEYEVQPGESLSVLAQRFLGNHRLFFILARYNDIEKPLLLRSGQTIRIPSDYWDGPTPSREPLDREIRAREHLAEGRPGEALALYENVQSDALGRDELTLVGTAHRRWIERALNGGDLAGARERLEAARRRAPDNGHWEAWLDELEKRAAAEAAYREGMAARPDDPGAAARALNRALAADPRHARARKALSALRSDVVPELHREAVILYRNQELDKAIELWEQALSIDPDFQPAQGYRARAEELRRRLDALE